MTSETTQNKNNGSALSILKISAVVILAFIGAIFFRQSAGIAAMFPIATVIFAATAFVGINPFLIFFINGITVFAVNTVEQKDFKTTLVFTALCLLATAIFQAIATFWKKNKKVFIVLICVGAILCSVLNVFFVGNPFKAIVFKKNIDAYLDEKYPDASDTYLGNFDFSKVYYNLNHKQYGIDAVSDKYPTEYGFISYNGRIDDGFEGIMADKMTTPYCLEMMDLLRHYFPEDSFAVKCDAVALMPNENLLTLGENQLNGRLTFEITLDGVQTASAMIKKAENYVNVIDNSDIEYAEIIFKGGKGIWMRRSIRVNSNRIKDFEPLDVEYVNLHTSNNFNLFVQHLTQIKEN